MGHPHVFFCVFFLPAHKISGGETSKGEDEPQSGVSEEHVASGVTTTGKKTLNSPVAIVKRVNVGSVFLSVSKKYIFSELYSS